MKFDPFILGFIFAVSEHLVKVVLDFCFQPIPDGRRTLKSFIADCPSFLAFAFIVGVGADWIGDKTHNHALEMSIALIVWVVCLLIRQITEDQKLWLRSLWLKQRYFAWKILLLTLNVTSLILSL